MIGAIVLAAGQSRRMGTQKLLLPYAGSAVIEYIVDQVQQSGVDDCIVVTGHEPHRIRDCLVERKPIIAHNDRYLEGMLSSVRAGFEAAPETWIATFIVLGDQPSLRTPILDLLIDAHATHPGAIIVPVFEDKRGHPILIPMTFRQEILHHYDDVGLRGLLHAHGEAVVEIPVDSESVLEDVNYPEDYERALRQLG